MARSSRGTRRKVHVLTHTLHYGLGAFEGIRCYQTKRRAFARSSACTSTSRRLFDSAHILEMPMPFTPDAIDEACLDTVRRNKLRECYLRPLVFLGDGEMGLAAVNAVRVAIVVWPWGSYLGDDGMQERHPREDVARSSAST